MVVIKNKKLNYDLGSLRLDKAMMILFKKRQIEIINKVIGLKKLNKTETEYFSRTIKPRINAIIDFYQTAIMVRDKE